MACPQTETTFLFFFHEHLGELHIIELRRKDHSKEQCA